MILCSLDISSEMYRRKLTFMVTPKRVWRPLFGFPRPQTFLASCNLKSNLELLDFPPICCLIFGAVISELIPRRNDRDNGFSRFTMGFFFFLVSNRRVMDSSTPFQALLHKSSLRKNADFLSIKRAVKLVSL